MSRRPASGQGQARIVSLAALALGDDGNVERSVYSLLNPGVDPGPIHVHGLTAEMLADQPCFGDVVQRPDRGAARAAPWSPTTSASITRSWPQRPSCWVSSCPSTSVMCTVELARRLQLGTENLRLETLAAHWGISQMRPHDAMDDALVLAQILKPVLVRARERKVWLPLRPVSRRQLAERPRHP